MLKVKQHVDDLLKSTENESYNDDSESLDFIRTLTYWKEKYPQVTWLNFPPFTHTGDINDAVFQLPPGVVADRNDPHHSKMMTTDDYAAGKNL
ncbi:unnamed protein product [Rotaria sp. Silwood1]|nr:unnamed protein product [Rotaria sp. Silwood1]CAF1641398.1 unnamed protein product [Rotaria sp. Silwood1]CAF3835975.1 unnamed protein product [Rotaria sp. Silwood1]CAF3874140.1 unnamed protein product [Rotaria sp. Silwood1]CAF3938859.1 unnamed protein product [Rotaria sp. Silwood1]